MVDGSPLSALVFMVPLALGAAAFLTGPAAPRRVHAPVVLLVVLICLAGIGLVAFRSSQPVPSTRQPATQELLDQADGGDEHALRLLLRRVSDQAVSPDLTPAIIETALNSHEKRIHDSSVHLWAELLARLDEKGMLSESQRTKFFRQLAEVRLRVRPIVRQTDALPFELLCVNSGSPKLPYAPRYRIERIEFCGRELPTASGWIEVRYDGLDAYGAIPLLRPPQLTTLLSHTGSSDECAAGRQTFLVSLTRAMVAPTGPTSSLETVWQETFTLSQEVEVLPSDAPDPVGWCEDDELIADAQQSLRLLAVHPFKSSGDDYVQDHLALTFDLDSPIGADLAFEVIAAFEERETQLCELLWAQGDSGQRLFLLTASEFGALKIPDTFTIFLRPSLKVARRTTGCVNVLRWETAFYAEGDSPPP